MGDDRVLGVVFHGVRGSTPCHGDDICRYGGNTSCVSLHVPGETPILFDLGTGLRYFGRSQQHDGSFDGTCLLTHLHWDHVQGLPFFTPLLCAGARLRVYGPPQENGTTLADEFAAAICPPLFPVTLDQFPGTFEFCEAGDDTFQVGSAEVMSRLVPHVGPTLGFRVTWNGRSVAYLSDHQQPYDGSLQAADGVLELVDGVDLLIHDAQYTVEEFPRKFNWGHCTADYALWLAAEAGAKRLALFHHDPSRHDDAVDELGARLAAEGAALGVEVIVAREGLTVQVP